MAAAPLAHRGFSGSRDLEVSAALKTGDFALFDSRLLNRLRTRSLRFGGRFDFIQPEVSAAFFANGRISANRFPLRMAARWARDRGGFGRRHQESSKFQIPNSSRRRAGALWCAAGEALNFKLQ